MVVDHFPWGFFNFLFSLLTRVHKEKVFYKKSFCAYSRPSNLQFYWDHSHECILAKTDEERPSVDHFKDCMNCNLKHSPCNSIEHASFSISEQWQIFRVENVIPFHLLNKILSSNNLKMFLTCGLRQYPEGFSTWRRWLDGTHGICGISTKSYLE